MSVEDFTADRRGCAKLYGATGFGVSATLGQLSGNSRATLRQLWVKGRRVYFVDMEHAAGIGHDRDLGVRGDFVGLARFWWPERRTQMAPPPDSYQTPVPSSSPTDRMSPDLVEGEPPEQFPSTTTPTRRDQIHTDEPVEAQACPHAAGRVVRHTHLQRVAFGLPVDGSGGARC